MKDVATPLQGPDAAEARGHEALAYSWCKEDAWHDAHRVEGLHCHLGLGKLYAHTDKREQAQGHLRTAAAMYREMDMPFWLEQVKRALRGA